MKNRYNKGVMPAPKKRDEDKRTEQTNVMFTPKEIAALKAIAAKRGMSVSTYIRQMALADYYKSVSVDITSTPDDTGAADI